MLNIERLKNAKKEKKLSYDELAQLTGLSRSTITNIFCGYIDLPRHETVQAIERALGLAPAFTEEEKALGLSDSHAVVLSDKDRRRFHVLAFADEVLGEEFVDAQINLLEIAANAKVKK